MSDRAADSSPRLLLEGAGRDAQAPLRLRLDMLPLPAIIVARDRTIVAANRAALALLEADAAEQLLGKDVFFTVAPEDLATFDSGAALLFTGRGVQIQFETVTLEGNRRTLETVNVPLVSESGELECVLGLARDITEQRRAERARDLLAAIVQSSDDAIVVVSPDFPIVTWNPGAEKLFGFTAEEAIGQQIDIYFPPNPHPTPREILTEELIRARAQRGTRHFEWTLRRKDGRPVEVSIASSGVYDPRGNLIGLAAIMRDVTEHKRGGRERALLASIVESSEDAIISKTPDRRIGTWNRGAEKLYGYSAGEIVGQPVSRLVPFDRLDELDAVFGRALRGEHVTNFETVRRRKNGELVDVALTEGPIRDGDGRIVGVAAIERDITERKHAQQAEALLAVEASRAKSQFLANMSHELRTPLNSIIGLAGMMLDGELGAEQRDLAENIRASSEALLSVVNDVLDFSRLSAGKLPIEEADFEVRATLEGAVDLVAEPAHRKRLELVLAIDRHVPGLLHGDPGRLRQVITNLVDNAVKFTEQGEVVVSMTVGGESEASCLLRVEVRDTGIGIAPQARARLFQPFSQVDPSTTRKHGGSGLGLAIAAQIVREGGGEIGCDSTPGSGSTFWFTMRLGKLPQPEAQPALKGRVLVVDDNATNRAMVRDLLEEWGITAASASGASDALVLLRAASRGAAYDVAIVDLEMPGTDGIELARAIKRFPALVATRVVMMSSLAARARNRERADGIDEWLGKPVKASHLRRCLVAALSRRAPEAAGEERANTTPRPEPPAPEAAAAGGQIRVLVAEDNIINQRVALHQLRRLGYKADGVANGSEALAACERVPYDAILMDCQMPEMDGYQATEEIRKRESSARHTLIIAMTAHSKDADRSTCLAAGMDDFLAKPVKIEELGEVLSRAFARRAKPTGAPQTESAADQQPLSGRQAT